MFAVIVVERSIGQPARAAELARSTPPSAGLALARLLVPIYRAPRPLFFAGGLVSEVMSTGPAMVVLAAPSYTVDVNSALAIQGLQFAALIQGQVGLGAVLIAVSFATRGEQWGGRGLAALGYIAGAIDILRPLAVTEPPVAIALFVPTFIWIAFASAALIRVRSRAEHTA